MAGETKSERTARRIAGVAAELFLHQGFETATVAQVAEAAEVATGTVLLHFGSKAQLATAAFAQQIRHVGSKAGETVPEAPIDVQLVHVVRSLYSWYETHAAVATILLKEALFSTGPWADHYNQTVQQTVQLFGTLVKNHQEQGTLASDIDPELAAEGILADYLLVLLQGLRGLQHSVDEQCEHFRDLTGQRLRLARIGDSRMNSKIF